MAIFQRTKGIVHNLFRRKSLERDLDAEVRSYAELLAEENMREGMNPQEARRNARLDLGGHEQVKEAVRASRAGAWFAAALQDLRYAVRVLRKNPGFTAVAALTLALGIGANTAVFSVVDAVVLRPLPYKNSSRMVDVTTRTAMFPGFRLGISWQAFEMIRSQASAFEEFALYSEGSAKLTNQGAPAQLQATHVSSGFFEELGAQPQLGRLLLPQDQQPGQDQVAVLGDVLWRTRFGSALDIVGKTLVLNAKPYVVVGVAQKAFRFPTGAELWLPLSLPAEEQQSWTAFNLKFVGKLRRGETLAHAQTQLQTIATRARDSQPALHDGYELSGVPLIETYVYDLRKAYLLLLGAATLVLLISCSNLASMLLARGWSRQREMALRAALGASRGRILRQVLVESLLLACVGGAAGILLAVEGLALFRAIAPPDTPRLDEISISPALFWFALGASLVAGLIFGLAPARRAASLDPNDALKQGASSGVTGTGSAGQPKLGGALVVVEVALAFILLIGAGLMFQSFSRLLRVNPGMRTDHLLTFDLPTSAFDPGMSAAQMESVATQGTEHLRETLARIGSIPGVEGVAATDHEVLGGTASMQGGLRIDGALPSKSADRMAYARYISPSFLQVLDISLLRGRNFTDRDTRGAPKVVLVNETMARQYWGSLDVLGRRLSVDSDDKGNPKWCEVVGVVADTRDVLLRNDPHPEYYLPAYQLWSDSHQIIVRTAGDPQALAGVISKAIWEDSPEQLITNVRTMTAVVSESVGEPRLHATLLGIFAAVGLALALLGVYGVLAYSVARRTREIGIRMALGADRPNVLRMVLRQGLRLAFAGIVIGAAGALALTRVIASELFETKPADPLTFGAAALSMLVVAALACYVPARRALRVDPMIALRHD
jgi:putative ABC transport system permease protein